MFAYRSVFVDADSVFLTQSPLRSMADVLRGVQQGTVHERPVEQFFNDVRAGGWEKIQEANFLGNRSET